MKVLPRKFYMNDTKQTAKDLLGKTLVRKIGNQVLSGVIIETEAYKGKNDPASHASRKKTERNKIMFGEVGVHMFISHMVCIIVLMWLQKKKKMNLALF